MLVPNQVSLDTVYEALGFLRNRDLTFHLWGPIKVNSSKLYALEVS